MQYYVIPYCSCYFFSQYDVNGDGILEFVLTTTDAEIVFVQTDNTLLHGETIKVRNLYMYMYVRSLVSSENSLSLV